MDEFNEKIGEVLNKENSADENQQEIVPVGIEIDDENEDFECNIRALPNSCKYIQLMRETLGSLMSSKSSLGKEQDDLVRATTL